VVIGTGVSIATNGAYSEKDSVFHARDNFEHSRGRIRFKAGAEMRWYEDEEIRGNDNGQFYFEGFAPTLGTRVPFADFLLGIPGLYQQNSGYTFAPAQRSLAAYAIGEIHVSQRLSVSAGIRYELAPPYTERGDKVTAFRPGQQSSRYPNAPLGLLFAGDPDPVLGHVPRGLYPTDYNNFAPRIGIAYTPGSGSRITRWVFGDGKALIRAGWGVYYNQPPGVLTTSGSTSQPFSRSVTLGPGDISARAGSFANPFGTQPNPFPIDLNQPQFINSAFIGTIDPSFRNPYTLQYNFTLQRTLGHSAIVEVGYLGSNSFKQEQRRQLNPGVLTSNATVGNLGSRRLYPSFSNVLSIESSARARFDSLQVQVQALVGHRLTVRGFYVLSRAMDNGGVELFSLDPYPFRWARSLFDRRNSLTSTVDYDLPDTHWRFIGPYLSSWRISGIAEFRSGAPMPLSQQQDTTLTGSDPDGGGVPDLVGHFTRLDPRKTQTVVVNGKPVTGNFFFDPSAFQVFTATGNQARPGNTPRNAFDGPGTNIVSLSLAKTINITESHRLVFRADLRNVFNHANFDFPSLQADATASFGQVQSAQPGRTVQLSLRYQF
jgi:hypothetical protein